MDWQGLANWRICVGTKNWPPIGTGLAWIGKDWQIGEFVSEQKIGPRLAPDWHGLARIGKLANLCRNKKLAPDWHRIGMDWQGLANWRICVGTKNWPPIG